MLKDPTCTLAACGIWNLVSVTLLCDTMFAEVYLDQHDH